MDSISVFAIIVFLVVLVLLVIVREKTGNRIEVRNPDIMLALILPAIFLFASGKTESFEFGDLKIESAFGEAAQAKVKTQVTKLETGLPDEAVERNAKGGVNELPRMIRAKTELFPYKLDK